jgi:hypothetical protein
VARNLELKPWQVTSAAWLWALSQQGSKSNIMANNVGLRKIITALAYLELIVCLMELDTAGSLYKARSQPSSCVSLVLLLFGLRKFVSPFRISTR